MAEGLTVGGESLRLGMIGDGDGPFYGQDHPDVCAAYLAGGFFRWFAELEPVRHRRDDEDALVDDEMFEWEIAGEEDQ